MGKQIRYTEVDDLSESSNQLANDELYSLDDEDFFDELEDESLDNVRPQRNGLKKRSRDARRLIEQYWEERSLREQLDEYYMHPDD